MLETLQIRSRAVPPEQPRRRGATSVGPERDRFGVLKAILATVPWMQVGLGALVVLLAAMVPWGTDRLLMGFALGETDSVYGGTLPVLPGDSSLAELLGEVGDGVYVTSWLGGNADSTTGDFSLGLRGHMIEGGKIGRPVGEMNVTGNLKDLFSRIELIGNDPYPYSTTLAPSMVFSGVDFSGA